MPKPLKELIHNIIPQEHQWKITLFKHWDEIIGPMKDKVIIEKIEESVLVLGVCHPAWAQELFLLSPMLKQKINRYLQKDRISRIRFKFLDLATQRAETIKIQNSRQEAQKSPLPEQYVVLNPSEKLILDQVNNQELRSSLEQFLQRCKVTKKGVTP